VKLDWETLDRRARAADLPGVASLILQSSEAARLAFAPELEKRVKGMKTDDWEAGPHHPGAGYALAAVGCLPSAARAGALLGRRELRTYWSYIPIDRLLEITRARELPWVGDLGVRLAARISSPDGWSGDWKFVSTLLREGDAEVPVTDGVVRAWLNEMHWWNDDTPLVVRLRESPHLDRLLPAVFEIDGLGSELNVTHPHETTGRWDSTPRLPTALVRLVTEGRLDRTTIINATVDRLVRDDKPASLRAFIMLHDALTPSVDESAAHTLDYARMLSAAPSTVAAMAQRALRTLDDAGRLEVETLLEASAAMLTRKEKALVKTQLGWLEKVARREPGRAAEVLETVAVAFGHPALELQERALTLIARRITRLDAAAVARLAEAATVLGGDLPARAAALFGSSVPETGPPVVLGLPPLAPPATMPPPIAGAAELAEELASLIHHESAVAWERVLAGLVSLRVAGETAALAAALEPVLDRYPADFTDSSWAPRPRVVFLAEAIRSVLAPTAPDRTGGLWQRMVSVVRIARQDGRFSTLPHTPDSLLAVRIAEIAVQSRRAPIPALVCTPTHVNGNLDAGVLLDRLLAAEAQGWQPFPVDFEQALLRVSRAAESDVIARAATLTSEAGRQFSAWLAGGLPDPVSTRFEQRSVHRDRPAYDPPPTNRRVVANLEPVRADGLYLDGELFMLTRQPYTSYHGATLPSTTDILAMVLPQHREVTAAWALPSLAALADQDDYGSGSLLPLLAECAGPIGPAMSLALAYGLAARQQTDRVAAVDAFLTLAAGQEAFAAAVGSDLGDLGSDGTIKLNRIVPALSDAHGAGASLAVWEVLAAALPLLLPQAPRGLADLLELASQVATAVGATDTIPPLADVAGKAGSSRLVKEARRLQAVLDK
jgi:hypothetical protein